MQDRRGKVKEFLKNRWTDTKRLLAMKKADPEKPQLSRIEQKVLNSMLIDAIEERNLDKVKRLLKQGADVNARKRERMNSRTALMLAANKRSYDICYLLISMGADVNKWDRHGDTARYYADFKTRNLIQSLPNLRNIFGKREYMNFMRLVSECVNQ